ncbi:cell division protein ZipA C-terminal FtsZ-binding domain-containing protein [Thiomicrospira sp. WB1]|uniref:cell division protein ZipA C-terminal FtsZ-binding domain-containing protein n=1 Tax=Thiomicrospira sp. WB1 TaxID=1685380 RepID=UPI0007477356|nr:cell division protein ZipA C-terminal FtsZ-binding domain-containing protein [Thiomicrospira sp. WB1]KUJ72064.1 cell division-like protein [Thiomicrospira sp. WB1]
MNELQWILLGFATLVIIGLLLLNQFKKKSKVGQPGSSVDEADKKTASSALNELGEAHIPVSQRTQARLAHEEDDPDALHPEDIPDSQLALDGLGPVPSPKTSENNEPPRKPKHLVIQDEELRSVHDEPRPKSVDDEPDFGIPKEAAPAPESKSTTEPDVSPQVFALIVMGTDDFPWPRVNQTLQGVGLVPNEKGIFVKKDTLGNEIIRVASLLEPGTFPIDEPTNDAHKTAGIVLILELPSTVKAPAVMHDMIMMARKISQRLNGRLYDQSRHLIKESDLQAMRDAAVAYESSAV